MKTIKFIAAAVVVAFCVFTSCKKNQTPEKAKPVTFTFDKVVEYNQEIYVQFQYKITGDVTPANFCLIAFSDLSKVAQIPSWVNLNSTGADYIDNVPCDGKEGVSKGSCAGLSNGVKYAVVIGAMDEQQNFICTSDVVYATPHAE